MADAAACPGEEQRAARLIVIVDCHLASLSQGNSRVLCAALELQTIVQPIWPILPELHGERDDPEARPVWRAGNAADRKPCHLQSDCFFECHAAFERR